MDVLKRSGKRERFSFTKLQKSIQRAASDTGLAVREKSRLVSEVAGSVQRSFRRARVIKAVELRRRVLRRLDGAARNVAQTWRRFDRKRR